MIQVLWGRYNKTNAPIINFDPLQSFKVNEDIYGFRVAITPSRGNRPREFTRGTSKLKQKTKITKSSDIGSNSVLMQIVKGKESCVILSVDDEYMGNGCEQERVQDFSNHKGIAIVNKYSPLGYVEGDSYGLAILSYPTRYIETLENSQLNYEMLVPLKAILTKLIENPKLQSSLIFLNNGRFSGASLSQLHIQAYVLKKNQGTLSYAFQKAFSSNSECIACKIANNTIVIDHLSQDLKISKRIIWEDRYMRILVPFAPIRPLSIRILAKNHKSLYYQLTDDELKSLGKALAIANQVIIKITPPGWSQLKDRTIAFRQAEDNQKDFHFFVDMLTTIPLGGAEVVDFLSVSSLNPFNIAEDIKSVIDQIVSN